MGDKKQPKDIQGREMCIDGRVCPAGVEPEEQ